MTIKIGSSAGGNEVDSALADGADATHGPELGRHRHVLRLRDRSGPVRHELDCVDNSTDPATPVSVGANNSVDVTAGSVIVCTFTNTRNQGSIELKKHWVGHAPAT